MQSKTLEVMSSIPARRWVFLIFLSLGSVSLIRSLKEVLSTDFLQQKGMFSCGAWGKTSITCTDLAKNSKNKLIMRYKDLYSKITKSRPEAFIDNF